MPASTEIGGPGQPDRGGVPGGRVDGSEPRGARAGWIAKVGMGLTLVSAFVLSGVAGMGFASAALLAGLLVLLPALGLAQALVAQRPSSVRRMSAYASSALTILVIGALAFVTGMSDGGLGRLGLQTMPLMTLAASTLAVLAAATVIITGAEVTRRWFGVGESALLATLLPRTSGERGAFVGLSLAAGWGEELAYRGYAIPALMAIGGGRGRLQP